MTFTLSPELLVMIAIWLATAGTIYGVVTTRLKTAEGNIADNKREFLTYQSTIAERFEKKGSDIDVLRNTQSDTSRLVAAGFAELRANMGALEQEVERLRDHRPPAATQSNTPLTMENLLALFDGIQQARMRGATGHA